MASALFPQSLLHSSGPRSGLINGAMWQNVAKCPQVAQHHEAPVVQGEISKESKVLSLSAQRVGHQGQKCQEGTGTLGSSSERSRGGGAGCAEHFLRQFDAHPRALVDDHDAVGVAQVHDLLGVGVVAGAEGVGPQPAQQVEVLHNQGPVQAFATDLGKDESPHVNTASLLIQLWSCPVWGT